MTADHTTPYDGGPDGLAQQAVAMFLTLVRRGTALAIGTLAIVSLICIGGFVLGAAALSDSGRILWIVVGGAGAIVGIGAVVLAITRLAIVKVSAMTLVEEFQRLLDGDPRTERMVIDTIEATEDVEHQSAVVMSRQFFTMRDSISGRTAQFVSLGYALRAMTTFPFLMLLATVISIGFVGFSVVFVAIIAF
jgi:hypothetical protein